MKAATLWGDDWAGGRARLPRRDRGAGFGWRLLWWLLLPSEGRRTTPTATGFVLIMVCFGLGAAAYNAGGSSNILFLALSLLFSSILLSGVLSAVNFQGLRWRIHPPAHFRVQEAAEITVEVVNTKRYLPSFSLLLAVETRREPSRQQVLLERSLPPGSPRQVSWTYTPQRRGREWLRVAAIESSYPFGFLRKFLNSDHQKEVLVWPSRVPYEFAAPETQPAPRAGEFLRRPGAGEQLYNIRRYQSGDQQRMVHWKATARNRRLMVRQLMDERQDGFLVVVELLESQWPHEVQREKMLSLAASLGEDLFRRDRLLAYSVNGSSPHAVARLSDLHTFLEALALAEPLPQVPAWERLGEAPVVTFSPQTTKGVHVQVNGRQVGGVE